jgi:hypothetical protein
MADVTTPPTAKVATADVPVSEKQQVVKPEQPDEAKYKEDLAKAEKEHTAAQEKFVGVSHIHLFAQIPKFPQAQDANIRSLCRPSAFQPIVVSVY